MWPSCRQEVEQIENVQALRFEGEQRMDVEEGKRSKQEVRSLSSEGHVPRCLKGRRSRACFGSCRRHTHTKEHGNCEARGPGWLISTGAAASGNLSRGHLEERKRCWPHFLRKLEMGPSTWQQ